ncbi:MAG: hypothetical protein O3B72_09240, partial [Proteobacteria bacterium]|nr:hypothetical protein [Pseudomonadota bacterium]
MSYHRRIQRRPVPPASDGRQPGETGSDNQALLERLFRIRGIAGPDQMDHSLAGLIPPNQLKHIDAAATLVADALTQ